MIIYLVYINHLITAYIYPLATILLVIIFCMLINKRKVSVRKLIYVSLIMLVCSMIATIFENDRLAGFLSVFVYLSWSVAAVFVMFQKK